MLELHESNDLNYQEFKEMIEEMVPSCSAHLRTVEERSEMSTTESDTSQSSGSVIILIPSAEIEVECGTATPLCTADTGDEVIAMEE